MNLPPLKDPPRYRGLYVVDFGAWTAVGYTAEEISFLLEHPEYRDATVYRIHRAHQNGQLELCGVSRARFSLESGMFFVRQAADAARGDYEALLASAGSTPPPCRASLEYALADISNSDTYARGAHSDLSPQVGRAQPAVTTDPSSAFITALRYSAEHEDSIGRWLNQIGFLGGDRAEGGVDYLAHYYATRRNLLAHQEIAAAPEFTPRRREEVLATVRNPIQR